MAWIADQNNQYNQRGYNQNNGFQQKEKKRCFCCCKKGHVRRIILFRKNLWKKIKIQTKSWIECGYGQLGSTNIGFFVTTRSQKVHMPKEEIHEKFYETTMN